MKNVKNSPNYENEEWGQLRAKEFGRLDVTIPSQIDYEKTCELIVKIQKNENPRLTILDFGGGNLSLYSRISIDFPEIQFEWTIVENFVYYGEISRLWGETQAGFEKLRVGFRVGKYPNLLISDRLPEGKFDLCIAGAVLGWVDTPFELLEILANNSKYLIISRTLMAKRGTRRGYQRTRIGEKVLKIKCWFLNIDYIYENPRFKVLGVWNSTPEKIYTLHGRWNFKSLILQVID